MGNIFRVELKEALSKYHAKYLTDTLKYVYFIQKWKSKNF